MVFQPVMGQCAASNAMVEAIQSIPVIPRNGRALSLLCRFLPPLARAALDKALEDAGIVPEYHEATTRHNPLTCG